MQILDPSVKLLATLSERLQSTEIAPDRSWDGSPFSWIRSCVSRRRGAIGEKLISEYLAAMGFSIARSPDREADRLINGVRTEIKMSTLWANGAYRFQQFRDQNYEIALCLGISPFVAHCWALPKSVIREQRDKGGIPSQHAGRAGRDTAWLHVNPDAPQEWLRKWGGELAEITSVMERLAPGPDAVLHEK